ncbi:hypothetical protein Tcan_15437 [Toxocara canis]|uniref:Uncharacterized protein n=1 Tax=Toxocara canis TaxID=6265 RepID=A0A0B2VJL1_TOXCA|nr:hypothetical protein Tcan_15437 [Toxocara canis]
MAIQEIIHRPFPRFESSKFSNGTSNRFVLDALNNVMLSYQHSLSLQTSSSLRRLHAAADKNDAFPFVMEDRTPLFASYTSLSAILPVCAVLSAALIVIGLLKVRSWRKQKYQLRCLQAVYDILEDIGNEQQQRSFIYRPSEPQHLPQQTIYRAITFHRNDPTPFFQPPSRIRSLKFDKVHYPRTANDVLSHFSAINMRKDLHELR